MTPGIGTGIGLWNTPQSPYAFQNAYAAAAASRMWVPMSRTISSYYDRLQARFEAAGLMHASTGLDAFYMWCLHDGQASCVNLIQDRFDAWMVNSPIHTPYKGFAGDSFNVYLNSLINPHATQGSGNLKLNADSVSIGIGTRTVLANPSATQSECGNGTLRISQATDGAGFIRASSNSSTGTVFPSPAMPKALHIDVRDATNYDVYENGVDTGGSTRTSAAFAADVLTFLRANGAGFGRWPEWYGFVGPHLTAAQHLELYSAAYEFGHTPEIGAI